MPRSRTPVEKGHRGGGVGFLGGLSVSCQFVLRAAFLSQYLHTHRLFLCVLFVSCTSSSIIFYLVSLCFFLFAVSFFLFSPDRHHHNAPLPPPPPPPPALLMPSFTPPLHPSNVGGQPNNIQGVMVTGSPLPVVLSCYCSWSDCCLAPALY